MTSPGAVQTPLVSQNTPVDASGYALSPGAAVDLRCRAPGSSQWTTFATAYAAWNPIPWADTQVYHWAASEVVPASCWTRSAPGQSAANFGAYYPSEGGEVHRIPQFGCVVGLGAAWEALQCTDFPSWTRLTAPNGLPSDDDPLLGIGSLTVIASGLSFAEGPAWDSAAGHLRFSDIETDTLWSVVPGASPVVLDSGSGTHLNGQTWYPGGMSIRCEHATQRVVRGSSPGKVIAGTYGGQPLNSPNDAVVALDGTIYFTDPTYGSQPQWGGATPVLGFRGLYRITDDDVLHLEHSWTDRQPNGIVLSPDGGTLYVSDTQQGEILSVPVLANGSLGMPAHFAWVGGADGMTVDVDGNLYVPGADAVHVFAPNGSAWGTIGGISQGTNATFGGPDRTTLFITTRSTVHAIDMVIPGAPDAR